MTEKLLSRLSGEGLGARALRGITFSVIGFGGGQFIRLASNLVLTRILFPEAFGLMALVQVVLVGLEMFSDFAIDHMIIQSARGDDPKFLNTAWVVKIVRGVILWLLACLLAVPVANFYEQEMLAQIIPIIGLTSIISGLASTKIATSNRHLMLGRLTVLELGSQAVGAVIIIGIALWLQTVWALVIGALAFNLIKTVFSHIILPGAPNRLEWDKTAFRDIFNFGKYIFFGSIAGFLILQGDRMILGKYIALDELAIYTIALMFASLPLLLGAHLSDRVLLPIYRSRPPLQSEQNRREVGKIKLLITGGLMLAATILALSGELIILGLYDARYHAAGPLLVLISLSSLPAAIFGGYARILLANGNSRDFTFFTVSSAALKISILLLLVNQFGTIGAVFTPLIADLAIYPLLIFFIRPYRGWYPLQDLGFIALTVLVGGVALFNSPTALALLRDAGL